MAYYAYKRVRERIPQHLEDKYREESGLGEDWYFENDYDGDLWLAAADYIDELQAEIDSLMLEYCPEEMTEEQKIRWAKHQRASQ